MSNFSRNLPLYRPEGNPAFGWIQIPNTGLRGDVVTINGDSYTLGIDFTGNSAAQQAASLAAAIRADQNDGWQVNPNDSSFFRTYSAYYTGRYIVIFAVVPGAAGNAFTLATSTDRIVISGATFAGGTNVTTSSPVPPGTGVTTNATTRTITAANTAQQVFAAGARKYLIIQNQSADVMYVRYDGNAATQDSASVMLIAGASITFDANFVPNGVVSIIGTTIGDKFNAQQA